MADRSFWKGYLKLSLVTCPVSMAPATTESEKVRFHTLNRTTGNRVESRYVDSQTGKPVKDDDQARGYARSEDDFVVLEDEFAIPIRQIDDEAKEQRERETLEIQRRATVAAEDAARAAGGRSGISFNALTTSWIQLGIGVLTLIGLGASIHFTRKALANAQTANEIASKSYFDSNRAWIKYEEADVQIKRSLDTVGTVSLVRNIGKSPALNLIEHIEIIGQDDNFVHDEAISAFTKRCTLIKPKASAFSLFPDQTYSSSVEVIHDFNNPTHKFYCVMYCMTYTTGEKRAYSCGAFTVSSQVQGRLMIAGKEAFSIIDKKHYWNTHIS